MRVVIADDEPEVVHHLKAIVEELGHAAVGYTDGNALMRTLVSDPFDLLMLDWNMPGKDGLLHISQIAHERVEKVTDYLSEGQIVRVKVLETDEKGRVKLSMKALLDRPVHHEQS